MIRVFSRLSNVYLFTFLTLFVLGYFFCVTYIFCKADLDRFLEYRVQLTHTLYTFECLAMQHWAHVIAGEIGCTGQEFDNYLVHRDPSY